MPTQIQLKTVEMVEMELESAVHIAGLALDHQQAAAVAVLLLVDRQGLQRVGGGQINRVVAMGQVVAMGHVVAMGQVDRGHSPARSNRKLIQGVWVLTPKDKKKCRKNVESAPYRPI